MHLWMVSYPCPWLSTIRFALRYRWGMLGVPIISELDHGVLYPPLHIWALHTVLSTNAACMRDTLFA